MNNLGLIDKLVFITDIAENETFGNDNDIYNIVLSNKEEIIEELEKDNEVYILTYGQDPQRTHGVGDKYYFESKDNMINKIKHLLLEDGYIDNIEQDIYIDLEVLGQYEVDKDKDTIVFETDTLDFYD